MHMYSVNLTKSANIQPITIHNQRLNLTYIYFEVGQLAKQNNLKNLSDDLSNE